jgi:hypothetical protein
MLDRIVGFFGNSKQTPVADNVGSNPTIAGSAHSIAGSVADNSGLNAGQLQIIPVGKWR